MTTQSTWIRGSSTHTSSFTIPSSTECRCTVSSRPRSPGAPSALVHDMMALATDMQKFFADHACKSAAMRQLNENFLRAINGDPSLQQADGKIDGAQAESDKDLPPAATRGLWMAPTRISASGRRPTPPSSGTVHRTIPRFVSAWRSCMSSTCPATRNTTTPTISRAAFSRSWGRGHPAPTRPGRSFIPTSRRPLRK